jgi:TRAP-type uncharacterized transport system fused permease subunit
LLLKAPAADVVKVLITAMAGLAALAAGINGWAIRKTTVLERAALIIAGILLIYPAATLDLFAAALVAGVLALQLLLKPAAQAQ